MKQSEWEIGKSLRMSRLFDRDSGHSVIVAMDHSFGGAHKGFEDPGKTLENVMTGEPDGIILTPGTSRKFQSHFAGRGAPAMIVSIDYVLFHSFPGSDEAIEEQGMVTTVEEALRLGADGIKVLMIFGRKDPSIQARNFDTIGKVVEKAHQWGLPVMIEPTTWGHKIDQTVAKKTNLLRDIARIAFEFGADIVKVDTPENPAEFKSVSEACPVPILVLGGAKRTDTMGMLREVAEIMTQGASGVTFGRNIWQHPQPERIIRALKRVVYLGDLENAFNEIGRG
jgi:class I fructose-bisphosphate aldolase